MRVKQTIYEKHQADNLATLVSSVAREDGVFETKIPGLIVGRISAPISRQPVPYKASLCIVVQGQKQVFFGETSRTYNPLNYLVVPMEMPMEIEVKKATKENPVLGMALELDMATISELLLKMDRPPSATQSEEDDQPLIFVSRTRPVLLDALIRLLHLQNNPADLEILYQPIIREVIFRVLQSDQGGQLRQLALRDSGTHRIVSLINYLNDNLDKKKSIDDMAKTAGMSASAFHYKFKEVTSMSPLQYLKKIRLHQAQLIMANNGLNAREAAFQVGYENTSQFSREFKRLFGLPPAQMAKNLSVSK